MDNTSIYASMPTIPDLDRKTENLTPQEAVDICQSLPYDKGLYVKMHNQSVGEDFHFIRRRAPIGAEDYPFQYFHNTNGAVQKYPASSIVSILKNENVESIILTPVSRMPRWGDGSVHYTCYSCHKPCTFDEMEIDQGRCFHQECLNSL